MPSRRISVWSGHHPLAVHRDLILVVLLAIVAVAPRLALYFQAPIFVGGDSTSYLQPAYDLLTGQGLTTSLRRSVGYPLSLAAVFATFGPNPMAVAAIQHVLGVLTVALTYALGRLSFGRWVGFGAALLVAISGPQLAYEHTLMAEAPSTLLLVALAVVLIRATRATTHRWALLAGVLLGLAVLIKPAAQALLPLGLFFASLRPGSTHQRLVSTGALVAAFALVVSPWMLRNLAVNGSLSAGGRLGQTLLASTARHSRGIFVFDGATVPPEPDPTRLAARRIVQAGIDGGKIPPEILRQFRTELGLDERDADRLARQLVFEVIARQPGDFLGRIPHFIRVMYNEGGERSSLFRWDSSGLGRRGRLDELVRPPTPAQEASKAEVDMLLGVYQPSRFGLALPLVALVGLVAGWRLRPLAPALVPGLLSIAWVLVHVVLDGPPARYRYPVEPLLDVLAVGAVWTGFRYAAGRWRSRSR